MCKTMSGIHNTAQNNCNICPSYLASAITTVQTMPTGRRHNNKQQTAMNLGTDQTHQSTHGNISQTSTEIWHTWCQSIENNDGNVDGAMAMYVEHSHESHHKHASSDCQELRTNTCNQPTHAATDNNNDHRAWHNPTAPHIIAYNKVLYKFTFFTLLYYSCHIYPCLLGTV